MAKPTLFSVLRILRPANHPRAWKYGEEMEGVWYRDGHYPEDATPKCSFVTTCLPWSFAEMRKPFLKPLPSVLRRHRHEGRDRASSRLRTKLPATTASTARMTPHGLRGWVAGGVAAATEVVADGGAGPLLSLAIGTSWARLGVGG